MNTHTSKKIQVSGNTWQVIFTPKYVSILKLTNNPFKTLGREFANLDEAINHYKSMQMKAALIQLRNS